MPLPWQQVGEDTLVFCRGGGICVLNATAQELLGLCDGTRPAAAVIAAFRALHPEQDPAVVAADAEAALQELRQCGVIATGVEAAP